MILGISRKALTAVAIATAVGVSLYIFAQRDVAEPTPQSATPDTFLLVDVDSHGAVVLSADSVVGHRRNGTQAWTADTTAIGQAAGITCAAHCPDMVLSGTSAPVATDPAPQLIGSAQLPADWDTSTSARNTILAADTFGALRLASTTSGDPIWESRDRRGRTRSWGSVAGRVILYPRNAERTALTAQIAQPDGGVTTYLFHASAQRGWTLVDHTRSRDGAACMSADGRRWVLNSPEMRTRSGDAVPFRGDTSTYGGCSFTRDHTVLTSNVMTPQGPRTAVLLVDDDGRMVKRVEADTEVAVSSSEVADAFVLVAADAKTAELYDARGTAIRQFRDILGATFDERGDLCLLDVNGGVRWISRAQLSS